MRVAVDTPLGGRSDAWQPTGNSYVSIRSICSDGKEALIISRPLYSGLMRQLFLSLTALIALATTACETAGQSRTASNARYVASSHGQVYYPLGCDAWRSLSERNLIYFGDAREAEAAGYRRTTSRSCAPDAPPLADGATCTVERVIDGDTVECREGATRIRLLLIDAPEMSQGEYGRRAREIMQKLLPLGEGSRLELDVQHRDRYGRTLAYMYTEDGRMVNEEMVRRGYAVVSVYPPNVRHVERLRAAAAAARDEGLGLWSGSAFECSPADYRVGRCDGVMDP